MAIKDYFYRIINEITDYREHLRHYPAYRILERGIRVSVFAGIVALGSFAYENITNNTSTFLDLLQQSWQVGWIAMLDKLKNEWARIYREYELSRFESLMELFVYDEELA